MAQRAHKSGSGKKSVTRAKPAQRAPGRKAGLGKDVHRSFVNAVTKLLDIGNQPVANRATYLAHLAKTKRQTAWRWLDEKGTALPDLASFRELAIGLGADANYLLGLTEARGASLDDMHPAVRDFVEKLAIAETAEFFEMDGDEMEPRIPKGSLVIVDKAVSKIAGTGLYAFERQGVKTVRLVEDRFGSGLRVRCENKAYEDISLQEGDLAKAGLKVLGRVRGRADLKLL